MPSAEPFSHDTAAIALIRGLAMDAPLAAKSGHQGTAMALAPLAHVLYSRVMRHDPADPAWPDRDRFVLSNGHASILQYALLHLCGYGLELDDLRAFRQWGSATPGHPEAGHTAGVEVTTGPLGQGFANAVGMAIAERVLADRFGADAVDHHTWVIAGDGCLMEGVSHEAASLAGHLRLGKLVCVFDDNRITIDGSTSLSTSDDVAARFRAYGWDVRELGEVADDLDVLEAALLDARADASRPHLLVLRSHIGHPSPDHTDDHEAHGLAFDADDVRRTKEVMGIPDEPFWAPADVVSAYRTHVGSRGARARGAWAERAAAVTASPEWQAAWGSGALDGWDRSLPVYEPGTSLATRQAIQQVLDAAAPHLPGLVSGAADLTGNTGTKLTGAEAQSATTPGGRQVFYGVREHAMGSAMVGMALHGGILPVGGTFFVFLDYMRPPVRLAALSGAKVCFVFSHDSVGVGEDGPTHQPVEHLATLRAVPGLQVIRPADANETRAALQAVVEHDGPSVLVLSRQAVRVVTDGSAVATGAGVVGTVAGAPDVVLVATGSEVALCVDAAARLAELGVAARVVSMPSWDRFARHDRALRDDVLPPGVPVLSVEAGTTFGWERWADDAIGIDRFGASAPGAEVLSRLGIELDHVVARATALAAGRST
ncbi:MAG: transketolase [Ilumatobacteraceae bacterium]|jgi:transketolase|nr:transketolase [Ilumatobacteraceae bacterium]